MQTEVRLAQKYLMEMEKKRPWQPEYFECNWEELKVWGMWSVLPILRTWCWVKVAHVLTLQVNRNEEGEKYFVKVVFSNIFF